MCKKKKRTTQKPQQKLMLQNELCSSLYYTLQYSLQLSSDNYIMLLFQNILAPVYKENGKM